jgi:hypothetical protein
MSFTARELEDALGSNNNFYWGSLEYKKDTTLTVELPVEVVDSRFGGEGDWQCETFIVIKVGDQYFKKYGHYASHDGEYWDGPLVEVELKEKVVKDWEEK